MTIGRRNLSSRKEPCSNSSSPTKHSVRPDQALNPATVMGIRRRWDSCCRHLRSDRCSGTYLWRMRRALIEPLNRSCDCGSATERKEELSLWPRFLWHTHCYLYWDSRLCHRSSWYSPASFRLVPSSDDVGFIVDKWLSGKFPPSSSTSIANSHSTECSTLAYHPGRLQQA